MSTRSGYAGSESDPEFDEEPTAVHEPTSEWAPPPGSVEPPVAPPPDLGASGNAQAGLITAASSDRCTNCGAQLAPDQHYCVVCGERRGRARFAGAMFGPQAVAQEPAPASGPPQRGGRFPAPATLIAGIATLLIAMGLGILIGHDSNGPRALAQQPKVNVTVNGGGGGGGSGSSTGASTTASTRSTSKSSPKAAKASTTAAPKLSAAQQQQAASAAAKAAGGSSSNLPAAGTQVGGKCTHGAGCQGGKFTGNFFGG